MSNLEKSGKMLTLLNYRLRVNLLDGRMVVGQMLAFDRHMNLVLSDCEEFRKLKIKGSKEGERREREEKRMLGLIVLRGETIVNFTIEAPPPVFKDTEKRPAAPTNGPGVARPAGRGAPLTAPPTIAGGPPSTNAVPGLVGPGRIGGPAAAITRPPLPPPPPGWRPGMPLPAMPGMPPMPGMPGMPPLPPPGTFPGLPSSTNAGGTPGALPGMLPPMPPGFRPPPPPPGFPPSRPPQQQ